MRAAAAVAVVVLLAGVGAFAPRAHGQSELRDGTAVYEDLAGTGTCSFPGQTSDQLHVGVSTEEYADAGACGSYLEVTGPAGVVRVQVTDHCRQCPAGMLDLSRSAFERIADLGAGRVAVRYQLVRNPALAEPISVRVKDGSSGGWAQFQVIDHGNPLAQVELANPGGGWRPLPRSADNFWSAANPGPGSGPHRLRITDIYGQTVIAGGITLAPGVQPTQARLYPPLDAPPAPAPPPTTAPGATTSTTVAVGDEAFDPTPTTPDESAADEATGSPSARRSRGGDGGADDVVPIFVLLAGVVVLARITTWRRRRRTASPNRPRLSS